MLPGYLFSVGLRIRSAAPTTAGFALIPPPVTLTSPMLVLLSPRQAGILVLLEVTMALVPDDEAAALGLILAPP